MFKQLRRWSLLAVLAALFLTTNAATAGGDGWTVDFEAAKKMAAESNKDMLLEFTGSDWCPPCKALKANIFDKPEFSSEAPSSFVLVMLDYPNNKSNQTAEEIAQNEKLQKEYSIQGFPTVILADAQGRPYWQTVGFGGGTPAAYVENLKKQQQVRVKRDENLKKAETATGVEKAKFLDAAIGGINPEVVCEFYKSEVEQIIALDTDNGAGLKSKYEAILKTKQIKAQLQAAMQLGQANPAKGVEAVDKLITEQQPSGELLQEALLYKGFFLSGGRGGQPIDNAKAIATLEEALKVNPTSQTAQQINGFLAQLKAKAAATPQAPATK